MFESPGEKEAWWELPFLQGVFGQYLNNTVSGTFLWAASGKLFSGTSLKTEVFLIPRV